MPFYTVFALDVSGSMKGNKMEQLKKAVLLYIEISEKIGLQEKIAIVTFGGDTSVKSSFTTNYSSLKRVVQGLTASGGTPMGDGLAFCLKEISEHATFFKIGNTMILPRIILLTDGEPDNKEEALSISKSLGTLRFPITAMGVSGCDTRTMSSIAQLSGGVFLMINEIDKLVEQFLQQLFLLLFIMEMQNQLEDLYNTRVIKSYLEDRMNRRVSDEEVELFILYLQAIVVVDNSQPDPPRVNNTTQSSKITMVVVSGRMRSPGFEVDLLWTIKELKEQIERQFFNKQSINSLSIGGVPCHMNELVNSYNVSQGDTINVTLKVKGGINK